MDYVWYYGGEYSRYNFNNIPKVNEFFTCVASEIYYDKSKLEKVYNFDTRDMIVPKKGIRCVYVDSNTSPIEKLT